jgi:aldehyde dehydrogenase (NAD+)
LAARADARGWRNISHRAEPLAPSSSRRRHSAQPRASNGEGHGIDRTAKLFIGGKQVRPDGNYSIAVLTSKGKLAGEIGLGSRKDIRDAVSAARACKAWPEATAYNRSPRCFTIWPRTFPAVQASLPLASPSLTGASAKAAREEVDQSIERLFLYAGLADKFEGRVHQPPARAVTLALHEPVGVVGIVAPDNSPLLGLISLVAPALAMGNTVVAVPSERYPLLATDLYQVIEYSDIPAGAINIVTGRSAELAGVLAKHDDVDGLWVFADAETCAKAEAESVGNLKRVWSGNGRGLDWASTKPPATPSCAAPSRSRMSGCLTAIEAVRD